LRPLAGVTYLPGYIVQRASQDSQYLPDQKTVLTAGTGPNQSKIMGVISETWPGFDASLSNVFTAPINLRGARGTLEIDTVIWGYHPAVYIDQSDASAVAITDGSPIVTSRSTSGYGQGAAAGTGVQGITVGNAALPGSGMGSNIGVGALVQASQTATIATPAVGDMPFVSIQLPYAPGSPGQVQTAKYQMPPLTTAQAATPAAAATALAAFLNGLASFATFFTAVAAAAVVTITVNANASPFLVNYGTGSVVAGSFSISLSGVVANSLAFGAGNGGAGTTTVTPGGAQFAGGVGFKGTLPIWVRAV
jgi:hypothetical protein